jgi:hypothetical protein
LKLFSDDDLLAEPTDVAFHLGRWLPVGAIAVAYGAPGVGKSLWALHVARCVAAGISCFGDSVLQTNVLVIAAEGAQGIRKRIRAWDDEYGVEAVAGIRYICDPIPFDDRDAVIECARLCRCQGFVPGLFIVDTVAATTSTGFDENSTFQMKQFLDGILLFQREFNGAGALLIHHSGHNSSRERGSTALRARADVMLRLERTKGQGIKLSMQKARDISVPEPLHLHISPSRDSAVLQMRGEANTLRAEPNALTHSELRLLAVLGESPTPVRSGDWKERSGLERSQFYALTGRLGRIGFVTNDRKRGWCLTSGGEAVLAQSGSPVEVRSRSDRTVASP